MFVIELLPLLSISCFFFQLQGVSSFCYRSSLIWPTLFCSISYFYSSLRYLQRCTEINAQLLSSTHVQLLTLVIFEWLTNVNNFTKCQTPRVLTVLCTLNPHYNTSGCNGFPVATFGSSSSKRSLIDTVYEIPAVVFMQFGLPAQCVVFSTLLPHWKQVEKRFSGNCETRSRVPSMNVRNENVIAWLHYFALPWKV